MSKYTTVFFDWGVVIADDPGDDFLRTLVKKIGATDEQVDEIIRTYMKSFMIGEISETEYWGALKKNYGLSIPDTISEEFKKWNGLQANQDMINLINEIKNRGFRVAILSNVIEPTYNVLDKAGLYAQFEEIIASYKVGLAKPDRDIYQLALNRMRVTAEESIFVDDKQKNLDPANEMGFTTILAQNSTQTIHDLKTILDF